jgi:type IV secretion system protein VirB9
MKALLGVGMLLALAAPAAAFNAAVVPQPCNINKDHRIRCAVYEPMQIYKLYTAPSGVIEIQFPEGEEEADKDASGARPDTNVLDASQRGNFLYIRFTECAQAMPLLVTNKTASGNRRPYRFQVQTTPDVCGTDQKGDTMVRNASVTNVPAVRPVGTGNLKNIGPDDLGEGRDIMYAVIFRDPNAGKKTGRASRERQERAEIDAELARQMANGAADPWVGARNPRYSQQGDQRLYPRLVWDNGYLTAFQYPGVQRFPAIYRINSDGKPELAQVSVKGDTIWVTGTAQRWIARDGTDTVAGFFNHAWRYDAPTPGTGTVSPNVQLEVRR